MTPRLAPVEEAEFIVGAAEIAELLHVDTNTIHQWKLRHADFPKPIRVLTGANLWDVRDVEEWARRTGRWPADPG